MQNEKPEPARKKLGAKEGLARMYELMEESKRAGLGPESYEEAMREEEAREKASDEEMWRHLCSRTMGKDVHVYPAIFEYADDGISISVPDLPGCFSCAETDEEALRMAKDAVGLTLHALELEGSAIPAPSPLKDIVTGANQRTVLVEVFAAR